jgi:UDP-N-acetylmuramoyl-tripeptide--D-alanyl-D-alanine ligase
VPRLRRITFGPGGDVSVVSATAEGVVLDVGGKRTELDVPFRSAHLLTDLCAAAAAATALGVELVGGSYEVEFSGLRGERVQLAGGVVIINDCYNANPMSMRAALEDLASQTDSVRRVAVLGDMLELGRRAEEQFHLDLGEQASDALVALLVTVGPRAELAGETFVGGQHVHAVDAAEAADLLAPLLRHGDVVLVKGSRGVGLEAVARRLALARAGS